MKIIGCLVYVILGLLFCYYEGAFDKKNDTVDFFCYLFMFLSWPVIFLAGIILIIIEFFTGIGGGHGGYFA